MIAHNKMKLSFMAGCICLSIAFHSACAEESWRTDFDAACAQSNVAMILTIPELRKLIEQCDRLQKILEEQEETVRKVYLKRLQMCKNLYIFVLETKKQEQQLK